jgi:alpha-D-xyloside xylohydrolase
VRLSSRIHFFLLICLLRLGFAPSLFAQWLPFNPVKNVEPQSDGVLLALENGYLRFHICSDSIVHIIYALERDIPNRQDFLVTKATWPKTEFLLHTDDPKAISLTTHLLKIEITRADSSILFYDAEGHKLTQENTRTLTPIEVNGEKTHHSERFVNMWDTQEAFYGLGQHQAGVLNYRGEAVETTPIFPFPCCFPATATAFYGTTDRVAVSTIGLFTRCT